MSIKLGPLLYDWEWSNSERSYITPYQQIWDEERVSNGNIFPTFDTLANGLADYNPIDGNAVDYLNDILCYGKLGADSISGTKATSSHLCVEVGGQVRKRGEVMDFIPRERRHSVTEADIESVALNKTTKRWFIDNWEQGSSRQYRLPTTGDAFDLASGGTLRPEFYNFFRYRHNEIEMEGKHRARTQT
jgi:hypothetical protein